MAALHVASPDTRVAERHSLLRAAAGSQRFGRLLIHDFVNKADTGRGIQFCRRAGGSVFVAFRGIDSTVVVRREDFLMAFETPVPVRTAALHYLERIAARSVGPLCRLGTARAGTRPCTPP